MILKVSRLGNPVLRGVAREVAPQKIGDRDFQRLLDDMVETMHEYEGVGLAAPQIHVPLRVAVLEVAQHPRYPEMAPIPLTYLINPVVTPVDEHTIEDWEGCLSVPELRGLVPRYKSVRVSALGREGDKLDFVATDFHARVVQHETDHLNGMVYLDRMKDLRSLSYLLEWHRYALSEPPARKTGSTKAGRR
jgi:peptide deformylase